MRSELYALPQHYLLFDDDMLFTKPVTRAMFFESDGKPRAVIHEDHMPDSDPNFASAKQPGQCWFEHMPYILRLQDVRVIQARFPVFFRMEANAKCRQDKAYDADGMDAVAYSPEHVYNWYNRNELRVRGNDELIFMWGNNW